VAAIGAALGAASSNWSGYIAGTGHSGQVTCVEGAWIEPTVVCPRSGRTDVAVWVGIDGSSSTNLGVTTTGPEQAGTNISCEDGSPFQTAWWETVPSVSGAVSFGEEVTPSSGDHVWAQVSYGRDGFTMTVTDLTSQQTGSETMSVTGAARRTAEWIVEAPTVACSRATCAILPLARFSQIVMTGGLALIASRLGAIGDTHWARDVVTDYTGGGSRRTSVSALSSRGQTFIVTWRHV